MFKSKMYLLVSSSFLALLHSSTPVFSKFPEADDSFVFVGTGGASSKTSKESSPKDLDDFFIIDKNDDFVVINKDEVAKNDDEIERLANSFEKISKKAGTKLADSLLARKNNLSPFFHEVQPLDPVVSEEQGNFVLNKDFVNNVPTYVEMEQLSYALVKGFTKESTQYLEKFQNAGWQIKVFSGRSGGGYFNEETKEQYGQNTDVAGFVAYNPETAEAVVCFHGSQDAYDWNNNFDNLLVDTIGYGLNFHGRVAKGNIERYNTSKDEIYEILKNFHMQSLLTGKEDKFTVTVIGHSLGGAMGELAYADLSTGLALELWGADYKNADSNHIRAYLMSAGLVFDEQATADIQDEAGKHNVLQDAVEYDPVYSIAGRATRKAMEGAYAYGPTALGVWALYKLGLVKVANPQAAAQLHGKGEHIGFFAPQTVEKVREIAAGLPANAEVEEKAGVIDRIKGQIAPVHYGLPRVTDDDSKVVKQAFAPDLIIGQEGTLEERLNKEEARKAQIAKDISSPVEIPKVENPPEAKSWYKFW